MRGIVSLITAAVAAVIEVHDTMRVPESVEVGAAERVVCTWSSMQHEEHGPFTHLVGIGCQVRRRDIDKQPNAVSDVDPHAQRLPHAESRHQGQPRRWRLVTVKRQGRERRYTLNADRLKKVTSLYLGTFD
jgi:hypothetical protein